MHVTDVHNAGQPLAIFNQFHYLGNHNSMGWNTKFVLWCTYVSSNYDRIQSSQ